MQLWHGSPQVGLDAFRMIMPLLYRPVPWHQDMNRSKGARAGLSCPQCMELQAFAAIAIQYRLDRLPGFLGHRNVHQTGCRSAQQLPACPDDVDCDQQGDDRVQPQPPGRPHQTHASDNADRGPHIRHQVLRIRFEANCCPQFMETVTYEAGLLTIDVLDTLYACRCICPFENAFRFLAEGEGEMLRWLSRLHWWLADPAKAAHAAGAAREVLEPLGPSAGLAMAYSNLAQLHMLAQEQEPAVTWATKAIATAREVGNMPALAHALNNLGSARLRVGDLEGRALLEESLALARREGLDEHAARAFSNLSWTALDYREYERAASYQEAGLALAADRGLEGYVSYLTAQRARLHLDRGEWDQAEADALWVLARPEAPGITSLPALTVLARVRSRRGAPDAAKLLDQVWEAARLTGELQRIAPVAVARAEFAWLRDDRAGILAAIQPALALAAARQRQPWVGDEIAFWLWRAGEVPELRRVAAAPFALHMSGDWRGAEEAWARLGCPFERACALADGDTEAQLGALELYDRLGAVPASALVRRRLRAAGSPHIPRGPRPKTRSNAAGLTPRQAEVARLLVEGLGNPEIAARLFLSPRTVEHHVSAVLAKLGAADRDEAARKADRLGLGPPPT